MLPTRAWELLVGSLTAFVVHSGLSWNQRNYEVLSFLGATILIFSLIFTENSELIPGFAAIPTVIATSLIILSNSNGITCLGRFLGIRFLVLIGLVSYSAYLWHWPVLAFLRYSLINIDSLVAIFVVSFSFLMASISYKFVETPLRNLRISTQSVFIGYLVLPALVIVLSSLVLVIPLESKNKSIFPWEYMKSRVQDTLPAYKYGYNCQYGKFKIGAYEQQRCVYPENQLPNVLLIGDSNAAHYLGMIRVFADNYDFTVRNVTQSSCPLIFNGEYSWINPKYNEGCSIYRHSLWEQILKYDTVIIGGAWNSYDNLEFREEFNKTIKSLAGTTKRVIVLGKVPMFPGYNKDCQVRAVRVPSLNCTTRFNNNLPDLEINNYLIAVTEQYENVHYFSVRHQVCNTRQCSPYIENKPVYYDYSHLSMSGSASIGQLMIDNSDLSLDVFRSLTSN